MSGFLSFSTFSPESRSAAWAKCREQHPAWWLIVPTEAQVGLIRRSFPFLSATFSGWAALDGFAVQTVLALAPGTYVVSESELFALLGEVSGDTSLLELNRLAMQIVAWQEAGFLDASTLGELASRDPVAARAYVAIQALATARLGTPTLQTATWCKARLAALCADRPQLPNLLFEGFMTLSPVDERLVQALTTATELFFRLYDVHDAPPLDSLEQAMVEPLVKAGDWSGAPDPLPGDFVTVQRLAERLFGDPRTELDESNTKKRFAVGRFPTLAKQLVAIADAARRAWDGGALRSNTLIAIPDSPEVRVVAEALLAGLPATIRWSAPYVPSCGGAESVLRAARRGPQPASTAEAALTQLLAACGSDPIGRARLELVAQTLHTSKLLEGGAPLPFAARVGQLFGLLATPAPPTIDGTFDDRVDVVAHRDLLGRAASLTLLVADADGQTYPDWRGGFATTAAHLPSYLVHACKVPERIWLATSDAAPRQITDAFVDRIGAGPFSTAS